MNNCKHGTNHPVFLLLIMKITFLLCFVGILHIHASNTYAQKNLLTIKENSIELGELIDKIESETEFYFFFSNDKIDKHIKVDVDMENSTIYDILNSVFNRTNITYQVNNKAIILNLSNVPAITQQEKINITGIVLDERGDAIIGAAIIEKGISNGAVTDINGKFSISVNPNATIVVSYIGYVNQEFLITSPKNLQIVLKEDSQTLDEVVVVGFGTQKKVNLTGSVAALKIDEQLTNRSITNVSSALSGLLPGLSATQSTGMAGRNNAELMIRGMGTVNNANPLIVVDGMPDVDINRINMNDIESISVLKDATSSAVYGSRAANGVILITTKSGNNMDKTRVNFNGSYAVVKPTKINDFLVDYPRSLTISQRLAMANASREQLRYKDGTIDQWMALGMIDPVRYPNTDWWDLITRNGAVQNYNVSVSGGNEKSKFYISVGVMDEKGLQINNDFTRYNVRVNYDYKLPHNLNIGVRLDGNSAKMVYSLDNGFTGGGTAGMDLQYAVAGIYPYDPVTGRWGGAMAYGENISANNPLVEMTNNLTEKSDQGANGNIYMDWNPIKGLTARVDYSFSYYNNFQKSAPMPTGYAYNFQTGTDLSRIFIQDNAAVSNWSWSGYKLLPTAQIKYETTIANHHNIGLLAVYSEEYWYDRNLYASRKDRVHPSLTEINAALQDEQGTGGSSSDEGLRSVIGRLNYAAYDKYLLELNFRYDGSSKFLPGSRYGFFPSLALGWRFNEEVFIKKHTESWLSNGKLRFSYGSLGNNSGVSRYEQKETLAIQNYIMGGSIVKGFVNKKMVNKALTWEETTVMNIGLDLGFFNNRLTAELDYYDRLTTGMNRPSQMSIHLTGSYTAPRVNIGDLRNRGIEANITWNDQYRDLGYKINFNFSHNATVLEKWSEYLSRGWVYTNMPYHFVYTYESMGIAQTWNDVYNATPQGAAPGDILRKDLNGDGIIDGKDQKAYPRIQRDRPTTHFGLNGNFNWKGFDLAFLFQGTLGRKDFFLNAFNQVNFIDDRYATATWHLNNPWNLENREGPWPRLGGKGENQAESTFWLDNMAYLRLKNLQLGYTIPKKWLKSLGAQHLRAYVSSENLFTITSYRGLDPEKTGDRNNLYPINKSISFGISLEL